MLDAFELRVEFCWESLLVEAKSLTFENNVTATINAVFQRTQHVSILETLAWALSATLRALGFLFVFPKVSQRFQLEYDHEPLDLYQKFAASPEKPVRIKFIERD